MTEIASQPAPAEISGSAPEPTETPEVTPAESAESATANETPESTETPEPTGDKESESKALKELKRLRKRAQNAEKDAAYWRGRAEGDGAKPATETNPKPVALTPPKMEDFPDDYEAFRAAERKFYIEEAKRELREETQQATKARTTEDHEAKVKADFENMIEEEAEKNPDFPEIVQDMGERIVPQMARAIMVHKQAAELILYFHNNPKVEKECSRLAMKDPFAAASMIGEIAHELKSKPRPTPPKKVSEAPEPIKTVKADSSAAVIVDENDLPIDQYIERKNAKERARRKT